MVEKPMSGKRMWPPISGLRRRQSKKPSKSKKQAHLSLQPASVCFCLAYSSSWKEEAICSSETLRSTSIWTKWCHNPENHILQKRHFCCHEYWHYLSLMLQQKENKLLTYFNTTAWNSHAHVFAPRTFLLLRSALRPHKTLYIITFCNYYSAR
jgi:hypothetical protein